MTVEEELGQVAGAKGDPSLTHLRALRYASPEALYRAEYRRLLRLLSASASDAEVAADALQEAFVELQLR